MEVMMFYCWKLLQLMRVNKIIGTPSWRHSDKIFVISPLINFGYSYPRDLLYALFSPEYKRIALFISVVSKMR